MKHLAIAVLIDVAVAFVALAYLFSIEKRE